MKFALVISAFALSTATLGAQQTPPTPPLPPARPAPVIAPRLLLPLLPLTSNFDIDLDFDPSFAFDMQSHVGDLQLRSMALADQARSQADRALANIDIQSLTNVSTRAAEAMAEAQNNLSSIRFGFGSSDGDFARSPRAPWVQGDPADSLYRLARQAFNDGDWRRASNLFHDVGQKFPKSAYVADCAYYEAFSRYRIGTTEELHTALTLLSAQNTPATRNSTRTDVAALAARVRGALAARGDQQAAAQIAQDAEKSGSCNREDMSVKAEALNALGQMDPAAATPLLQKVLQRTDSCSAPLKRSALFMLVRRNDTASTNTLISVATDNAQDVNLRTEAISFLGQMPGNAASLRSMYAKMPSERLKSAVLQALARAGGTENVQFLLGVAGNASESSEMRGAAIGYAARDSSVSIAELDKLYDAAESRSVREQLIYALGRRTEPTAADKLMDIVKASTDPYARRDAVNILSRKKDDPRVTKFLLDLVGK